MPIYRLLLSLLFIPIVFTLLGRCWTRKEKLTQMMGRFALCQATTVQPIPSLWLHAASNGELNSAKAFLERLRQTRKENSIVITCNSASSVSLAKSLGYRAQLAPLDYWWSVQMFRRAENISEHITMESEIWPNRLSILHKKKIAIVVLGARISVQTSKTWSKFPQLAYSTVSKINFLSAQNAETLLHFQKFGLNESATGPILNLKSIVTKPKDILPRVQRANTCLAASTHPGEEEIILDGFCQARAKWPLLKLILAPRHPHRAESIKKLLEQFELKFLRKSQSDAFHPENWDVLLADTLGDMDLWYRKSGICIIGGSFKHFGGHTPYEPAINECALIHGPFSDNFKKEYEILTSKNASLLAKSGQEVSHQLQVLKNLAVQEEMAISAKNLLAQDACLDSLIQDVKSAIKPAK